MARWTSTLLKLAKKTVLSMIVITFLWLLYRVASRAVSYVLAPKAEPQAPAQASFAEADAVKFVPTTGSVTELESDRSVDAILSGAFGPAVVLFYATWCNHCVNMEAAYAAAAQAAKIPFVRIQGGKAPVSSQKYAVTGYPTVLGVANVGGLPRRFAAARTPEAFAEFAESLKPSVAAPAAVPAPAPVAAPAAPVAYPPNVTEVAVKPVQPVIEAMPPTVEVVVS